MRSDIVGLCVAVGVVAGCANEPNVGQATASTAQDSLWRSRPSARSRALFNRTDSTGDFTVTTGSFEGAPARGAIDSLHVQVFDPTSGAVVDDQTYGALGGVGSYDFSLASLTHGAPYTITGQVRSGVGAALRSVTLTGAVRYRPAVIVAPDRGLLGGIVAPDHSIVAPDHPMAGFPSLVFADVNEADGETGATVDCVLTINGTEADRYAGLTVEAGETSLCLFFHTFDTAGDATVALSVEHVSPLEDPASPSLKNNNSPHAITNVVHIVAPDRGF